jgi:hypothetical protein
VASTCDAALKLFRDEISQDEISQVGFHLLLMTVVKDREHDFARRVIARSWHPEWVSMYETENMTAAIRSGASCRARSSRSCGARRDTIRGAQREARLDAAHARSAAEHQSI